MPGIDFFADSEDEHKLVCHFFDRRFRFVPDLTYETSEYIEVDNWSDYSRIRSEAKHFFALSKDIDLSPLVTEQIRGSGWNAGKFFIRQREGGPVLSICFYSPYEKDGSRWLPTCSISYYTTHKNSITGLREPISTELRSSFREIVRSIKECGKRIEQICIDGKSREYWVLEHAATALSQGARLAVLGLEELRL